MALDLSKFIGRFVGEARDRIADLASGLAALERNPDDADALAGVFRSAHTIKGSARMLKLAGVGESAHRLEDVLAALRERRIRLDPALASLLLQAIDALSAQIDRTESSGTDAPPDPALCTALARAAAGGNDAAQPGGESPPAAPLEAAPVAAPRYRAPDSVRVRLTQLDGLVRLAGDALGGRIRLSERLREAQALEQAIRGLGASPRIEALAREMRGFAQRLREDLQAQEQLAADLGERALTMRMLPLDTVFEPSVRMVRELARTLGKTVRCTVQGGEIELDRQIVERLGEVLVHLLRNALDHGIEDPAERRAAGKPEAGCIRLAARHAGGSVVLEIEDDGRGLDRRRILDRAIRKGLIDKAQAAILTDERVAELIFEPGLSTSPIVTDLSGRGVGMDAVKRTVVDDLHGVISFFGRPGAGCGLALKLPLSLASMRVLLVESRGHCLGLAARHVARLVRVGARNRIDLAGRPALVLDNEFVALVSLGELLDLPPPSGQERRRPPRHGRPLAVVLDVRQAKLAVTVDRLEDACDMVVKTLPAHLRTCSLIAGILVTGDQRLASLLQPQALIDAARRLRGEELVRNLPAASHPDEPHHILVVDDSLNTREIVKEMLEACGYRASTAEDGLAGWQKALGGHYDAVLTDVEMPGLDGFSLAARLRAHEKYRTTPIVVLTSRAREEDKRRGIEVGADAYIVKGDFAQSGLLDTLHSLLG